jgi:hypothetical protein
MGFNSGLKGLNNINNSMVRSKMIDTVTMTMEE